MIQAIDTFNWYPIKWDNMQSIAIKILRTKSECNGTCF